MYKEFLEYNTVRNNAFLMAKKIFEKGLKEGKLPDILLDSLRGGAPMANSISEYLSMACKKYNMKAPFNAAVVAKSYSGVQSHGEVELSGFSIDLDALSKDTTFLLVEDIYDSGRTINKIVNCLLDKGFKRENITVVVHDYKEFTYKEKSPVIPDLWCRKHVIESEDDDIWIHYLSHELTGLTKEEAEEYYIKKYPELEEAMNFIL